MPLVRKRYLASLESTLSARGSLLSTRTSCSTRRAATRCSACSSENDPRYVLPALEQLGVTTRPIELRARSPSSPVPRAPTSAAPRSRSWPCCPAPAQSPPRRAGTTRTRAFGPPPQEPAPDSAATSASRSSDPLLGDPELDVRVSTTAGLVLHAGVEGAITGGARLEQLMDSPEPRARVEAAQSSSARSDRAPIDRCERCSEIPTPACVAPPCAPPRPSPIHASSRSGRAPEGRSGPPACEQRAGASRATFAFAIARADGESERAAGGAALRFRAFCGAFRLRQPTNACSSTWQQRTAICACGSSTRFRACATRWPCRRSPSHACVSSCARSSPAVTEISPAGR